MDKATHETLTEEFEVLQEQIRNQKKEAELRESVIKSMKEKKRKMEKEMWYKIMGKKEEELIRLREKLFQNENEARIEVIEVFNMPRSILTGSRPT